ncbi:hypothetical protein FBZ93_10520 [Bradyrhizobium macuxiense]|uniref:Uncharacterized protein n=1 Tax=Bradyrhizobium macuxiense TaxID=1755647 RepID=A0A560LXN1_9BRAD|nr:hypothetical protein FBZ93_10520 [Bradyrhizobium macuxiense]
MPNQKIASRDDRRNKNAVPCSIDRITGDASRYLTLIKQAIASGERFRAHAFEYTCATNDIEHRTTKAKHPWTTARSSA